MISLPRAFAQQAVDDIFVARLRDLATAGLKSRDRDKFRAGVFALHSDFVVAAGIIDSNFPE